MARLFFDFHHAAGNLHCINIARDAHIAAGVGGERGMALRVQGVWLPRLAGAGVFLMEMGKKRACMGLFTHQISTLSRQLVHILVRTPYMTPLQGLLCQERGSLPMYEHPWCYQGTIALCMSKYARCRLPGCFRISPAHLGFSLPG